MFVRIHAVQAKGLFMVPALAVMISISAAAAGQGGRSDDRGGVERSRAGLRSGQAPARVVAELLAAIFCGAGPRRFAPRMQVESDALAFGAADLNTGLGVAQAVPITNAGTMPLVISSVSFAGADLLEFTHGGALPLVIRAGGTAEINVWFDPSSPGPKTASLNIMGNDPERPLAQVVLSGTGIINEIASLRTSPEYGE